MTALGRRSYRASRAEPRSGIESSPTVVLVGLSEYPGHMANLAELVADCPRCGSKKITFDVSAVSYLRTEWDWQKWHEAFSRCRHCGRTTIFVVADALNSNHSYFHDRGFFGIEDSLNNYVTVEGHVSQKDENRIQAPEHAPDLIAKVFKEGATCIAVDCPNAAATMFRLCVDLATTPLLPQGDVPGLDARTRRDLGRRLPWLFDNGKLPEALRELSACIKDDGNDGAHRGTLTKEDAEDLLDFTEALLERMYTEPKRIEEARARRKARRAPKP